MKTLSIADDRWRLRRPRPPLALRVLATAVSLTLLAGGVAPRSQAATVDTLGGGRTSSNPSHLGFVDGNTFTTAQFNLPAGVALDPAGQFLYVADTANNALRKLSLAGNQTLTVVTNINNRSWLNAPVDVAVDGANNLYILTQGDGFVHKIDSFGNYLGTLNGAAFASPPMAFALNASTNILVTLTDGSIVRVNHPTNATTTTLLPAGTFSGPRGIEVMDNGTIVVSDTGNNAIRSINPSTLAVALLAPTAVALPAPAANNNGPSALARFNGPHHITKAGNNILLVADTGNHQVRQIDANGTVTLLYGVDPSLWSSDLPGWRDGNAGPNAFDAESRLPEGLVVDGSGNVYVTEQYYHIIRKVTSTGLTGPSGTSSGTDGGGVPNPPSLTISPQSGYFPMGTTVTVTSTSDQVFFTTDGTTPTTNSTSVAMAGGIGTIRWFNSTSDLTALRVAAFLTSGTNTVSTNVAGVASTANVVGVPGDVFAGRGATVYLPVVIDLRTNDQVRSIGFRVIVTPDSGAPPPVTSVNVIASGTNDFVGLTGVSSDGNSVSLLTIASPPNAVAVTSLSPTNYLAKNFGVTALLEVKIPFGAGVDIGDTYKVSITNVSGKSDGSQTVVPLTNGPSRTITITNISYLVGDTSPGRWYNAGDFGNTETNLDNADVNNVFLASLGIKRPYTASDAFNAMDAFPEIGPVLGDGNITLNDWLKVLRRSLRLDSDNFRRGWDNGALTNSSVGAFPSRVAKTATPPGSVWYRHASITATSIGNAVPGADVTVPVYINAAAGVSVKGVQFRASVSPVGASPALTQRPQVIGSSFGPARVVGDNLLPLGEVGAAYLADFLGSHQLGGLQFRIPANARAGDVFNISFSFLSGTLGDAEAAVESVTARVVVLGAVPAVPLTLPDQWQTNFFGSLTNPAADPSADADGDGVPNWKEYLAGTDPTQAGSRLRLEPAGLQGNGAQSVFHLLTAPGKAYVLESTGDLSSGNWTEEARFTGDGYVREFLQTNALDQSRFYRVRVLP